MRRRRECLARAQIETRMMERTAHGEVDHNPIDERRMIMRAMRLDREHLVVMLLNSKNRIIGIHTVSVGHLSSSIAHPREILKSPILANAAAFVLGHNHPSVRLRLLLKMWRSQNVSLLLVMCWVSDCSII